MSTNSRLLVSLSFVVVVVVVGAGCNGTASNPPTDGATTTDDGSITGCQSDASCGGATPRCDRNSGKCQPCLPTNDNCPGGAHCVPLNDGYQCSAACRTDADCPKSDGGDTLACCMGSCIDLTADTRNCGACGHACPAVVNGAAACASGVCVVASCDSGFGDCDKNAATGCEVATSTDANHCGTCDTVCQGGPNATARCSGGNCAVTCAGGFEDCDGNRTTGCETSVITDVANCGGCGQSCGSLPNATVGCGAAACVIQACNAGYSDCDNNAKNGCEVSKLGDPANCGACGKVCSFANAASTCQSGTCLLGSCNTGFANCDGVSSNGCETPVSTDLNNCGSCGRMCAGTNSTQQCISGACAVASCTTGYADCDGMAANGCEVAITNDVGNCGGCGKTCPAPANATATCANGTCGVGACKFGFEDCDKVASNGCEANLLSTANCGFCGNACSTPTNATAGCTAGTCGIGACNSLWGNCDNNPANGCEKSVATDVNNCGACGKACVLANATSVCLGGQCGISSCASGFSDCDASAATGCESPTASDVSNCGACNKVCLGAPNATAVCSSSVCGISCSAGFANCDSSAGNGCEINTRTDVTNCGSCGKVCGTVANGTPGCSSGACGIAACNTNFADCNTTLGDGCETNIATSLASCGACGKACSIKNATAACLGGQCGFVQCNTGFGDCDTNLTNGCEKATSSDSNNCGGCGVVCPSAKPNCVSGVCSTTPPSSCKAIKAGNAAATSGVYSIDPDGAGSLTAFSVYCNMSTDGGGWTLLAVITDADSTNWLPSSTTWLNNSPLGTPTDPSTNLDAKSRAWGDLGVDELMVLNQGTLELETTTGCLNGNTMTWVYNRNSSNGTSCAYSCNLKVQTGIWTGQTCQASGLRFRCMDSNGSPVSTNGYTTSTDDNSFFTTLDNGASCLDYNMGFGAGGAGNYGDFDNDFNDGAQVSDTTPRLIYGR